VPPWIVIKVLPEGYRRQEGIPAIAFRQVDARTMFAPKLNFSGVARKGAANQSCDDRDPAIGSSRCPARARTRSAHISLGCRSWRQVLDSTIARIRSSRLVASPIGAIIPPIDRPTKIAALPPQMIQQLFRYAIRRTHSHRAQSGQDDSP